MPNKKGGKKYKKNKKDNYQSKEIVIKQTDTEKYGQITSIKGSGRFDVRCTDGKDRMGIIRGKLRKNSWVSNLDLVLVDIWEFQDDKCSIIYIYNKNDITTLHNMKQIPTSFNLQEDESYYNYDDYNIESNKS